MPLFAVIAFDDVPRAAALRERHRDAHRAYFQARAETARFAGAFYGDDGAQCGSFLIFEAESAEALETWFSEEPFRAAGVYADFRILDFRVAMSRVPVADWDPAFPAMIPRRVPS